MNLRSRVRNQHDSKDLALGQRRPLAYWSFNGVPIWLPAPVSRYRRKIAKETLEYREIKQEVDADGRKPETLYRPLEIHVYSIKTQYIEIRWETKDNTSIDENPLNVAIKKTMGKIQWPKRRFCPKYHGSIQV